jgi:hypothetical protein
MDELQYDGNTLSSSYNYCYQLPLLNPSPDKSHDLQQEVFKFTIVIKLTREGHVQSNKKLVLPVSWGRGRELIKWKY